MEDTLVLVCIILLLIYLLHKFVQQNQTSTQIPGPRGYPIIGPALQIKPSQAHHQFYEFAKTYGDIFEINTLGTKIVVLNKVELIKNAFVNHSAILNDRFTLFIAKHVGYSDSITIRNFDSVHRAARKAFKQSLHLYGSGIAKFENIVQNELEGLLGKIENYGERKFEVVRLMQRSILNVMSILLIGEDATDHDCKNYLDFVSAVEFFYNPAVNLTLTAFPILRHFPFFQRRFASLVEITNLIQDRYFYDVKDRRSSSPRKKGIIDELLCGSDNTLPEEIVKNIGILDVFTAGALTTATLIPTMIICLLNYPEYQHRLQDEIDSVLGRTRQPAISDKQACPFLEATIMETSRLILPGPFWIPHVCKQDTVLEGYTIKANTQVIGNPWFIHHDESIWGDPWNFRPERFLGEDGTLLPNDHKLMKSWIPFGVGPRKCPGMGMALSRIFLYIATIYQTYTLVPVPGQCPSCDPRTDDFVFDLVVRPKPFYCMARKRDIKTERD